MAETSTDPFIGRIIENRFEITELVGHGGMADVYKGRHVQVDLTVAVKVLKAAFLDTAQSTERFKREAATVNSLFHPNIIAMYSYDVLETGQPYLVMDFLQGKSLGDLVHERGSIPASEAVPIFLSICRGVGHAHKAGVLHRDLKPHNVMLIEADNPEESVKVVDFGLAKPMPESGREIQQLTQAGEVFGSPLYMSPEQCTGMDLDHRSDIYSFGCLMYEALAGKPPLMGKHVMVTIAMHVSQMPPPFKTAAPEKNIPDKLEQIIFKTLQKDRESRYQSMDEIEQDLLSCLS